MTATQQLVYKEPDLVFVPVVAQMMGVLNPFISMMRGRCSSSSSSSLPNDS